jgi:hypothetical protein
MDEPEGHILSEINLAPKTNITWSHLYVKSKNIEFIGAE